MCTHYHHAQKLGLGHTLPIGEPWIPSSTLDHFLVSLPYPFGPDLEQVPFDEAGVRILWLLPITTEERAYKRARGLEALESRFDQVALEFWNARRQSVV
jgi:hypothetical protein